MTSLRGELKPPGVSSAAAASRRRQLNPTRRNQFGETPLHTAAIAGNVSLVERLLEEGACPLNPKDNCGWTPLHEACNHGHLEVAEVLLKAGAIVDPVDERCELLTPLHDACENGHLGIARLLLRYGADVCARNGSGETPVERLIKRRIRGSSPEGGGGDQLSREELADSLHLERQMLASMAEKGFSLDALRRKIAAGGSKGGGEESSSGESTSARASKRPVRNLTGNDIYDDEPQKNSEEALEAAADTLDIDEPGRGRLEYRAAIETVGRRAPVSVGKGVMPGRLAQLAARKGRTKKEVVSALIAESEEAPRDDWLIDDLGIFSSKKRGSRETTHQAHHYTPSPKKRRHSDPNLEKGQSDVNKEVEDEDDAFIVSSDEESSVREDFNCNYVNNFEEDNELLEEEDEHHNELTTTIEIASSSSSPNAGESACLQDTESYSNPDPFSLPAKQQASFTTTGNDNFCKIIIVQFDDAERSSFAIPLPSSAATSSPGLTFDWLTSELVKRYFRKFSVKPVLSLYTAEGAIISADDLVVDMLRAFSGSDTAKKPVFKARIESYSTEDPAKRFRELCQESGLQELVCEELAETLSSLRVSGCFNVANSFLGAGRQNQLMLQSLYRQEIKEINVSFSNLLLNRKTLDAFLTALSSMPTLTVLNLAGTAFPPKRLASLLTFSPGLRHLDLSFNAFGASDCAYAVSQIIAVYDRLTRLSLAGCSLRTSFLRNSSLIEAVEGASSLAAINLEHNVNLDPRLVEQFKTLNESRQFLKTIC